MRQSLSHLQAWATPSQLSWNLTCRVRATSDEKCGDDLETRGEVKPRVLAAAQLPSLLLPSPPPGAREIIY